ncbi:MAG: CBS domain-containing protein, partial [Thaumarchaeota archaeon]|nr:CBS domain-containing protein [Nitrososphaerota archaeon]
MQRTKGRKEIKVKDVYDSKLRHSEIVASDEPLDEVIRKFAKRADLRGLFLTDNKGKLVGVVTRIDLVKLAKFK